MDTSAPSTSSEYTSRNAKNSSDCEPGIFGVKINWIYPFLFLLNTFIIFQHQMFQNLKAQIQIRVQVTRPVVQFVYSSSKGSV